jgi:hypothetical protein
MISFKHNGRNTWGAVIDNQVIELGKSTGIATLAEFVGNAQFAKRDALVKGQKPVASYVRSHYNTFEVGIQDAPRPDEILFALVMADGGRIHSRLGGLTKDKVSVHDGQR